MAKDKLPVGAGSLVKVGNGVPVGAATATTGNERNYGEASKRAPATNEHVFMKFGKRAAIGRELNERSTHSDGAAE